MTQALEAAVQDAISYTYNDAGQVLAEAHTAGLLSGLTVTNAHNSLLQRTSLALKDSGGNLHSSAYTWDGAGRLSTVSDGTNSAAYSYLATFAFRGRREMRGEAWARSFRGNVKKEFPPDA